MEQAHHLAISTSLYDLRGVYTVAFTPVYFSITVRNGRVLTLKYKII